MPKSANLCFALISLWATSPALAATNPPTAATPPVAAAAAPAAPPPPASKPSPPQFDPDAFCFAASSVTAFKLKRAFEGGNARAESLWREMEKTLSYFVGRIAARIPANEQGAKLKSAVDYMLVTPGSDTAPYVFGCINRHNTELRAVSQSMPRSADPARPAGQ